MMAPPALCCCWRMLPPWYCRRFSCIRKHHGTTVSTVHCTSETQQHHTCAGTCSHAET